MKKKSLLIGGIGLVLLVIFLAGCAPIGVPVVTAVIDLINRKATISWTPVLGAKQYYVYYSENSSSTYNPFPSNSVVTTTSITWPNPPRGVYIFKVKAANSVGESALSPPSLPLYVVLP